MRWKMFEKWWKVNREMEIKMLEFYEFQRLDREVFNEATGKSLEFEYLQELSIVFRLVNHQMKKKISRSA